MSRSSEAPTLTLDERPKMAQPLMLIDEDCLDYIVKIVCGAEARPAAAVSLARTCVDARRMLSRAVACIKLERLWRFQVMMGPISDFSSKQTLDVTTGWWTEAEVRLATYLFWEAAQDPLGRLRQSALDLARPHGCSQMLFRSTRVRPSQPCRIKSIRCQGSNFWGMGLRRCEVGDHSAQGNITTLLVESLSQIEVMPLLRTLKFDSIRVNDDSVALLATSGVLGRLKSLSMINCRLSRASADSLASAFEEQRIDRLKVLDLNNNPDMGDEGVVAIAARLPAQLALLGVANCGCGDKAVKQLCDLAIARMLPALRVVNLSGNAAISNSGLWLVGCLLLKHRASVQSLEVVGLYGGAEVHKSTFLGWLVLQLICLYKNVTLWWPSPLYAEDYGFGPGSNSNRAFQGVDYQVNYPFAPAQTSIPVPPDLMLRE